LKKVSNQQLFLAIAAALTLGLAPFFPEPHLFGKIRWLFGGAQGMGSKDYFDLVLHGAPWIYLVVILLQKITQKR